MDKIIQSASSSTGYYEQKEVVLNNFGQDLQNTLNDFDDKIKKANDYLNNLTMNRQLVQSKLDNLKSQFPAIVINTQILQASVDEQKIT